VDPILGADPAASAPAASGAKPSLRRGSTGTLHTQSSRFIRDKSSSLATHTLIHIKATDPGLENFRHDPGMLRAEAPKRTTRRQRSCERKRHQTHNGTILGALRAIFYAELRPATIFHSSRILTLLLGHVTIATVLTIVYYHVHIDSAHSEAANFVPGIKDFADLCVTGIVFLLGGFVTTMLTRWWAVRSQCCGALHQSLSNLNMYAAAVWSTNDPIDRETRALLSRYAVAAYQLLFIEARAAVRAPPRRALTTRAHTASPSAHAHPSRHPCLSTSHRDRRPRMNECRTWSSATTKASRRRYSASSTTARSCPRRSRCSTHCPPSLASSSAGELAGTRSPGRVAMHRSLAVALRCAALRRPACASARCAAVWTSVRRVW
jgi:hypothetical protein